MFKSSLFILLLGGIGLPEQKVNSEYDVENIFVTRHIAKPLVVGSAVMACMVFPSHFLCNNLL